MKSSTKPPADKVISVTEFKAKCLQLLEQTNTRGTTWAITKRGKVIARVAPPHSLKQEKRPSLRGCMEGKIQILGDIINFTTEDDWEVLRDDAPSPFD